MDKPLVSQKTAKRFSKLLSVTLTVTTTVWLSGVALLMPLLVAAHADHGGGHKDGALIRASNDFKVWIVKHVGDKHIKRHLFGPQVIDAYGHLKAGYPGNVVVVDQATVDSHTTSTLIRQDGNTKVYVLENIVPGVSATKRWIQTLADFNAAGYDWDTVYITNAAETALYTETGAPAPVAAGLTVGLASDTPAAAVVAQNAARVGFTKVNLTASADADVTVDSLTVKRIGPSTDGNFSELILIDAATNIQIGAEKTLTSEHQVIFTDDFVVSKGTTRSVILAGNMAAALSASEQAALSLTAVATKSAVPVTASLPLTGNYMTMNATLVIGTSTVAAGGLSPSASTQKVGTTAYIFSSLKITAGSAEDIDLTSIRWYQNGTVADADLKNLELISDGAVVGSKIVDVTNKEALFKFPALKIGKGLTKEFSLRGDIVAGSSRTIDWVIDKKTDIIVMGKTYGYSITSTYPNSTSPFFNPSDTTTVATGSLTISKGTLASLNVASGGTQQQLGKFKFNAQGERAIVTKLAIYATSTITITNLTNLTIYDSAGVVVAGPVDPAVVSGQTTQGRATTTDTIIFPVGISEYTIKGNLNTSFGNNSTIQLGVAAPAGTITAKGETTNNSITAAPTADITGDTVTVKAGTLAISTSTTPAAQNVIAGTSNFTFANYVLDATNSGEDVRVTQLAAVIKTSANSIQTDLVNAQLYDGAALLPIVQPSAVAATTATTTFTLTNPIVVTKGTSKTITLKADVSSSSTAARTFSYGCVDPTCVTATGVSTATTVTPTVTNSDGQVMTVKASGSLTFATDAANPVSGLVYGAQTGVTLGELRLTATDEDVDVTLLAFNTTLTNSGTLTSEVQKLWIYDGATVVASVTPTSTSDVTFTITAGNLRIPKGSSGKKVTVKADFNDIGTGFSGRSGKGVALTVAEDSYEAKGVSSGTSLAAGSKSGTFTGNTNTLYYSVPTVSYPSGVSGTLSTGVHNLFRFTLAANSHGDIGLYRTNLAITTTTATVTAFTLFENPGASEVALFNNASRDTAGRIYVVASDGKGGVYGFSLRQSAMDTGTDGVANGGEYRLVAAGTSKVFELRGNVTGPLVTGSSVQVQLLGDEAFPSTAYPLAVESATGGPSTGIGNGLDADFIWSDLNVGNNSTTATQTAEWTNGFRVPGLSPNTSTAQTLTK